MNLSPEIKSFVNILQKTGKLLSFVQKLIAPYIGSDIRVFFYSEFLRKRTEPLTLDGIPNGSAMFQRYRRDFYEPVLNGDINLYTDEYVRKLTYLSKNNKFLFDTGIVTQLEDYFQTSVAGYYGRRDYDPYATTAAAETPYVRNLESEKSGAARFEKNPMTELTNTLGRYPAVYDNSKKVVSITDTYDFEESIAEIKKIAKKYKTFTWEMFKKNFQEDIIERFLGKTEILQKLVSGEANLNKIIYGTMFKINEVIHSEGYPGYQISLQFPCNVDPQRLSKNIERIKQKIQEQGETKAREDYQKELERKTTKKQWEKHEVSPVRKIPYTPRRCNETYPNLCNEIGAKCVKLAIYQYIIDVPSRSPLTDEEAEQLMNTDLTFRGSTTLLGLFVAKKLMTLEQAKIAEKYANHVCLPMEILENEFGWDTVSRGQIVTAYNYYKKAWQTAGVTGIFENKNYDNRKKELEQLKEHFKKFL